jgi:L-iditol 2-dehydrogenase
MKVARLHSLADIRIHIEPAPRPGNEESLIQVKSVGICGSDLHWFREASIGDAQLDSPMVLGHEFAGVVEGGEQDGCHVAVEPAINCGRCATCVRGHPNLCWNIRFAGHGAQEGALREKLAWPDRFLFPLPESFSADDGAMLEPLGVAIHAVELAGLKPGMSVGVFGCGPIGLLILQVALAFGASDALATDILPHRKRAAAAYGATEAILARGGREREAVWEATGGRGVDIAFEAAGEQDAVDTAVAACARGGSLILAGIPAGDTTSFSASLARRKGLTIKLVRRMKHTYPAAIRMVESGQVDVRSLVSDRFPLERAQEAFECAIHRQGLKVIVHP